MAAVVWGGAARMAALGANDAGGILALARRTRHSGRRAVALPDLWTFLPGFQGLSRGAHEAVCRRNPKSLLDDRGQPLSGLSENGIIAANLGDCQRDEGWMRAGPKAQSVSARSDAGSERRFVGQWNRRTTQSRRGKNSGSLRTILATGEEACRLTLQVRSRLRGLRVSAVPSAAPLRTPGSVFRMARTALFRCSALIGSLVSLLLRIGTACAQVAGGTGSGGVTVGPLWRRAVPAGGSVNEIVMSGLTVRP